MKTHSVWFHPTKVETIGMFKRFGLFWMLTLALTVATHAVAADSQSKTAAAPDLDFRIDVDVYAEENKAPIATLQTIFTAGLYIELDEQTGRTTVFDPGKSQITILDSNRKSLVHLDMTSIDSQLSLGLSKMTQEQSVRFLSEGGPLLEEGNLFSIGNKFWRYKFRPTTPSNPAIAISYGDFANWSVKLNAVYPPRKPPFRLQLNQLLIDQRQLPTELRRITYADGRTEEIVARLILKESLNDNDRARIASVYTSMKEYKIATDAEFFKK